MATQILSEVEKERSNKLTQVNYGCRDCRIGKFRFIMPDSSIVIIERNEKTQYEYYNGTTTKYSITWIIDCKYALEIVKADATYMEAFKGKKFVTNIYEARQDYFKYVCEIEGMDYITEGVFHRIE